MTFSPTTTLALQVLYQLSVFTMFPSQIDLQLKCRCIYFLAALKLEHFAHLVKGEANSSPRQSRVPFGVLSCDRIAFFIYVKWFLQRVLRGKRPQETSSGGDVVEEMQDAMSGGTECATPWRDRDPRNASITIQSSGSQAEGCFSA